MKHMQLQKMSNQAQKLHNKQHMSHIQFFMVHHRPLITDKSTTLFHLALQKC